jgi:hypothetical protein
MPSRLRRVNNLKMWLKLPHSHALKQLARHDRARLVHLNHGLAEHTRRLSGRPLSLKPRPPPLSRS